MMSFRLKKRAYFLAAGLVVLLSAFALILSRPSGGPDQRSQDVAISEAPKSETSVLVEDPPAAEVVPSAIPQTSRAATRLVVPRLKIDAATTTLGVDSKGTMQAPGGPMEVAWYKFSSKPNGGGNVVMSGHVDYANYGPAVFARLRE